MMIFENIDIPSLNISLAKKSQELCDFADINADIKYNLKLINLVP